MAAEGDIGISIEFHTLTQDEVDQYLQSGSQNIHIQARIDF